MQHTPCNKSLIQINFHILVLPKIGHYLAKTVGCLKRLLINNKKIKILLFKLHTKLSDGTMKTTNLKNVVDQTVPSDTLVLTALLPKEISQNISS